MSQSVGRLLNLADGDSAENMAIDQTLLESVDAGGRPALRLYGWKDATLSLGYFQRHADRSTHAESQSLPCVRRATGGGAIVHDRELTYSLVLPLDGRQSGPRHQIYRDTHNAMLATLRDLGVTAEPYRTLETTRCVHAEDCFLCFQRRTDEDLIVSGYKVVGSAQRTMRRAVLQHGSILLCASPFAPQLPGIGDLIARPVSAEDVGAKLVSHLVETWGFRWERSELSEDESARAHAIESEKFANDRWLHRR